MDEPYGFSISIGWLPRSFININPIKLEKDI